MPPTLRTHRTLRMHRTPHGEVPERDCECVMRLALCFAFGACDWHGAHARCQRCSPARVLRPVLLRVGSTPASQFSPSSTSARPREAGRTSSLDSEGAPQIASRRYMLHVPRPSCNNLRARPPFCICIIYPFANSPWPDVHSSRSIAQNPLGPETRLRASKNDNSSSSGLRGPPWRAQRIVRRTHETRQEPGPGVLVLERSRLRSECVQPQPQWGHSER
ncbi:hypothetical protein C8T65DRAFT_142565 [Cerioporus squamosus]|nr:hypothetical protein C8T65DRAFT_142565 [Cerioporus squamosus]